MRSPRERSAICAIELIRLPVRLVSWLSSSRAMVSTCWPTLRDFLRHHGKARALRAGARALDQRVQRQHLHLVGDLLDRLGLLAGDLVDLGGQPGDQRGDVGFVLGACRLGGRFGDRLRFESEARRTFAEIPRLCAVADLLRIGANSTGACRSILCRGSWLTIGLISGALRVVLPGRLHLLCASRFCRQSPGGRAGVCVLLRAIRSPGETPCPVCVCRRALCPYSRRHHDASRIRTSR